MITTGTTLAHPPRCLGDLPPIELAAFLRWVSFRLDVLPEFAALSHADRAHLSMLLQCRPSIWGPN
jgi:hypothetical protein